ncbi:sensor histidine kinase [Streptomyces sp. NPDC007074]|uniref:sensor histidine kinase n=1 Tax=Streptomyces sp. NPDC007074 TaxID=3156764 RepID=UPI0033FA1789
MTEHDGLALRRVDPDAWRVDVTMQAAFVALLAGSLSRLLTYDARDGNTGWSLALYLVFGVLHLSGPVWAPAPWQGERPSTRHLIRLGLLLAVWVVLLALEPSATWCTMPLLFTGVHRLPVSFALPLACVLTLLVVISELRVASGLFNPNLVIAPVALATVVTAVLLHSRRLADRQRLLIDDLLRARGELAAHERRTGVLEERQRLSAEIHDILAQSLSSQQMLLQAAERQWHHAPDTAHEYVRQAAASAGRALTEVRRFVRDLAPLDLDGNTLVHALRALAEQHAALGIDGQPGSGPAVEFRVDGTPENFPEAVEKALLRVSQGALANIREHSGATRAVITLTCSPDSVSVDIADNGRGFEPARIPHRREARTRGHGLPLMESRARQAGGTLRVESAHGEGTVVSMSVALGPHDGAAARRPLPAQEAP